MPGPGGQLEGGEKWSKPSPFWRVHAGVYEVDMGCGKDESSFWPEQLQERIYHRLRWQEQLLQK